MIASVPQLQLSDIASILALAKTAKIDVADSIEVGQIIERVEIALTVAKIARPEPTPAPEATPEAPQGAVPAAIKAAVRRAAGSVDAPQPSV